MPLWGGEEFIVFLEDTSEQNATMVAEKLRSAIEAGDTGVPVTVSIGIASIVDGAPLSQSIEAADKALYRAKASGRNRVCFDQR